jgi:predicted ATP-grasp superfamily ATP-dependent carboligase
MANRESNMKSMREPAKQTGAVVVGGELGGLGMVRSLVGQGMPVTVVDTTLARPACWSRQVRSHRVRSLVGRTLVEDLVALGQGFSAPPVLLLTDEDAVHAVSEYRDELAPWYRLRLPADPQVKMLSSKAEFHRFAETHDFPVPRTCILASQFDLPLLDTLRYPCVLKPDDKRQALNGSKERALRADTLEHARAHARAMLRTPGGIVAQEWIEGAESNIYFTLFYRGKGGETVAAFTGRKLACWPPDVGSTAVCVAAPLADVVLAPMTLDFAARAGFDGMGSMEYKWDDIHERFVMIEPTVGRCDWQEEIATLCGVNIPLAACRHELGLPALAAVPVAEDAVWRATFIRGAPSGLMPANARVHDGYFRWNDPLPAIRHYCLNRPLDRLMTRCKGWLQPARSEHVQQEQQ